MQYRERPVACQIGGKFSADPDAMAVQTIAFDGIVRYYRNDGNRAVVLAKLGEGRRGAVCGIQEKNDVGIHEAGGGFRPSWTSQDRAS